ncbi:MAG: transglycosylase SLT domain-containing protein [Candidatus Binatia bacterium]
MRPRARPGWPEWSRAAGEAIALGITALVAVIAALSRFAEWFVGAGLWRHLLPFAAAVLVLAIATGACLSGWLAVRPRLAARLKWAPLAMALAMACAAGWFAARPAFWRDLRHLQVLVGGQAAAARAAIGHQVFAAYRRLARPDVERMFARAQPFSPAIHEAAVAFGLDADLLMGLAAAESSFAPRRSADGGRGLFQITVAPASALRAARAALSAEQIDLADDRHNAFVGAAVLRRYLDEVRGDLFLALLAYNIGPANGGLRAIMERYGARDFVTIQPYLQALPRDYPIRVLSNALAYRLWRTGGALPPYEEGDNAQQVQAAGIPGMP